MKIDSQRQKVMQKIVEEAHIERLLDIIVKLDKETKAEVLKALSSQLDISKKNFHLANIRKIIQASDDEIKDWIVEAVVTSYAKGGNMMYADLKKTGVKVEQGQYAKTFVKVWTADKIRQLALMSVQKDAVNALVAETYLDFANGMNGLVAGVERQLNEAIKRQVRARMVSGQITGASMRDIAKEVADVIGQQGFSVLIDRGGNTWTLDRYANMLARTHIIKSANEGAIARAVEFGVDTMQVSTHAGACPICVPYEGKLYSVSGKGKYPSLGEFPNPIHPHCRHSLMPRPDLDRGIDAVTNPNDDEF